MTVLSKSKLIAFRQCPRRLWLEVHRPDLEETSAGTQATFDAGNSVGAVARLMYDPKGVGSTLDLEQLGVSGAIAETPALLAARKPIFEAGFEHVWGGRGARAFADVMIPLPAKGAWKMVEVKSSTSVKDYHLEDASIQYYVATRSGVDVRKVHLATINSSWVYAGDGNYAGLLEETDVTAEAAAARSKVQGWLREAHKVVAAKAAPSVAIGLHCNEPFACGFTEHCQDEDDRVNGKVAHPIRWLPGRFGKELLAHVEEAGVRSLRDVPDELLNERQLRVKTQSLSGKAHFDATAAAAELSMHKLPALFLDFETIGFAVPVWAGTRPYEQIPFQFSVHSLEPGGVMRHSGFLDLSGSDPSERLARALVKACSGTGPVFAYNASLEGGRLQYLADRYPSLARRLLGIKSRLVDLLPVVRRHYYHPQQEGSWSIKSVLPTIAPELDYANLEGVQDGGRAQSAYLEAIQGSAGPERKAQLQQQLLAYCRRDTFAMVKLWSFLSSRMAAATRTDRARSMEL